MTCYPWDENCIALKRKPQSDLFCRLLSKTTRRFSPLADYSTYTDEQLVLLFREGDESAFTELFHRYWEKMLAFAMTKNIGLQDAKEVVQDVFIRIWNHRSELDLRHKFNTYISAAIRHAIIDTLRKQDTMNRAHKSTLLRNTDGEWLHYFELHQQLEDSISDLPERCRLIFRLSKQQGLSNKEVAVALDISEKTVETHLTKAYKSLRISFRQFFTFFL